MHSLLQPPLVPPRPWRPIVHSEYSRLSNRQRAWVLEERSLPGSAKIAVLPCEYHSHRHVLFPRRFHRASSTGSRWWFCPPRLAQPARRPALEALRTSCPAKQAAPTPASLPPRHLCLSESLDRRTTQSRRRRALQQAAIQVHRFACRLRQPAHPAIRRHAPPLRARPAIASRDC